MSASSASVRNQPHPAPHRERVNPWAVWFGLLGAPLAWGAQLLINSALGAHGCYPHDVPLAVPVWSDMRQVMLGVEVAAILVCAAALLSAWFTWRRARHEKQGSGHHVVEAGDGRTRFMAMAGLMTSLLFLAGAGFACINVILVPACAG